MYVTLQVQLSPLLFYTLQLGNSLHRVKQNELLQPKMQFISENREEINNHTSTWKKSQTIEIMHIQSE